MQRNQRANCQHLLDHRKSKRIPEKYLLLLIEYAKAFECVDDNKLWKILQEMGTPDHLTCLLRNLYAGQETTVRTQHGTTDLFHSEKEYIKAVYCHPAYLTYAEYIIWNARLDDAQAGIKIARRNINYLRYTDDTTNRKEWKWKWSCSVLSDYLQPHGLQPTRLLHPWDFPGKRTRVGCHFLLQAMFPTQGSNPVSHIARQKLYCLSYQGSLSYYSVIYTPWRFKEEGVTAILVKTKQPLSKLALIFLSTQLLTWDS